MLPIITKEGAKKGCICTSIFISRRKVPLVQHAQKKLAEAGLAKKNASLSKMLVALCEIVYGNEITAHQQIAVVVHYRTSEAYKRSRLALGKQAPARLTYACKGESIPDALLGYVKLDGDICNVEINLNEQKVKFDTPPTSLVTIADKVKEAKCSE